MFRDGLAFTLVYRYNFQPPKFQAGALAGLGGLNYTHVTVLNSATERMRRTGEHSDRYVGDIKFWENFCGGRDKPVTVVEIVSPVTISRPPRIRVV